MAWAMTETSHSQRRQFTILTSTPGAASMDQLRLHIVAHGPAHDLAAEHIHHGGQKQPALMCRDVGEIGQPDSVGTDGLEATLDQVGRGRRRRIGYGRPEAFSPARYALYAHAAHQPGHAQTAHPDSVGQAQFGLNPGCAVGLM